MATLSGLGFSVRAELNKCLCNSAKKKICAGLPQFHGQIGLHGRVLALGLRTKEGSLGEHQQVSSLRNTNLANPQEKVPKTFQGNHQRQGCIVVRALGLIGSHLHCEGFAGIHQLRYSSQLCEVPHGMTDCRPFGQ